MSQLNIPELLDDMLEVAVTEFGSAYDEVKDYVKDEFEGYLKRTETLAKKVAAGDIDLEKAKLLLQIHVNSMKTVFLTVEGIGLIAAQNAINGAIGVVKDVVNAALPVDIL